MKKIYNILLFCAALLSFMPTVNADEPPYREGTGKGKGIAYSKTVDGPDDDGIYTIKLESFVTGSVTVKQGWPADIVLVLDVSGSMNRTYGHDEYEALPSAAYSYDSYGTQELYYRYNNNYYQVTRSTGGIVTTRYRLRFTAGYTTYNLSGTGAQRTGYNDGVTSPTETIFTGVLYKKTQSATTRILALKAAVKEFIDVVKANDERSGNIGNQISIVKFASGYVSGDDGSSLAEGNERNGSGYNYTQVVKNFRSVSSAANVTELKNAVDALVEGGATQADYGMNKAMLLLQQESITSRNSAKTVVLFTDGDPTSQSNFERAVANGAIKNAQTIKAMDAYTDNEQVAHKAVVYTVGVFDNETDNIRKYMNNVSSNSPDADDLDDSYTDLGFYQNAGNGDLSGIFRSIATASGGAGAELDASSIETIDIVSASFELPEGTDTTDIVVKFAKCLGKSGDYLTFETDTTQWDDNPPAGQEGHVSLHIDGNKITATGFDYTAEWCGYDESIGSYRGHKMILLIPIEMAPSAVGGLGTDTNGPESGIYVGGENLLPFISPDLNLPTNIHIKKEGLAPGESAVFDIYRTAADEDGVPTSPVNWVKIKTVVVVEGLSEDSTVKLRGLDPNYAYKIVETGWSWGYDTTNPLDAEGKPMTEVTSDKLIENPFTFTNTKNTKGKTIINAESAVKNDFGAKTATSVDSKNTAPKAQAAGGTN